MPWLVLLSVAHGMYQIRVDTEVDRIAPDPSSEIPLAREVLLQFYVGGVQPQEQEIWVSAQGKRVPAQVTWWAEPWVSEQVNARIEPNLGKEPQLFEVHWGELELAQFEWSPELIVPGDLERERPRYKPSFQGCPGGRQSLDLRLEPGLWSYVEVDVDLGEGDLVRRTVHASEYSMRLDGDEASERILNFRLRPVSATGQRGPWQHTAPLALTPARSVKSNGVWYIRTESGTTWLETPAQNFESAFQTLLPTLLLSVLATLPLGLLRLQVLGRSRLRTAKARLKRRRFKPLGFKPVA